MEDVRRGRDPEARVTPSQFPETKARIDPDNLEQGDRIGADYDILSRLGQGGMAVVYAARHRVSGRTRALKIARPEEAAEEALRGEYQALSRLDYPQIVRVIDLTQMVEGRLTLVMERVGGGTLRKWLADHPAPDPHTQRRLAEHLLSGLDYLEQQGVTHKDLKPDNLLIDDDDNLTIIDFSLAAMPADAPYGGTALYRDPSIATWTHGTDRFAAALCLFEIYAGRHAFDGAVPEPGQAPSVGEDDIDPPGLAAFFVKALHPQPERRFPSARAMREALVVALGDEVELPPPGPEAERMELSTPLRLTGLPRRAINALGRCQIHTVGDLLALKDDGRIRAIHAIGTKTASDIVAFKEALIERGLRAPQGGGNVPVEPLLVEELMDSPEPIGRLPLPAALIAALEAEKLPTVGAVASLTRSRLLRVPNIGRSRLAQVVEALHQFLAHSPDPQGAHTLDRLWDLASRPLSDTQRTVVERTLGLLGEPELQREIAQDLRRSPSQVSQEVTAGLKGLDASSLAEALASLEGVIEGFGGMARLDELGERLEEGWPAGNVTGEGMVRLLVRLSGGGAQLVEEIDGVEGPVVAQPAFDRETLKSFVREVLRLATPWPPVEPDTVRRSLAALLPRYEGDPLDLGVRICADVAMAESGHLFIEPLEARQSIAFVLDQARDPFPLEDLERRVHRVFGERAYFPEGDPLMEILRDLDCSVQGQSVIPGRRGSVMAVPCHRESDDLPVMAGAERRPEEVARDMLREAALTRGFRMLVVPPERQGEIGRSVARALGGRWLSFEEAFFLDHEEDLPSLERAERFVAQREALTEAAEATMERLMEEYGRPGEVVVLGDTALWGLCEALDLPRRLYDETLADRRGFWVVVVPGVIHKRQPYFNEGPALWHLEGATLPLLGVLPEG